MNMILYLFIKIYKITQNLKKLELVNTLTQYIDNKIFFIYSFLCRVILYLDVKMHIYVIIFTVHLGPSYQVYFRPLGY